VSGPRSARGAAWAPWSRPSGTPHRVPAAETSPRRHACHGPSDRRRETTWSDRFAFGETLFQRVADSCRWQVAHSYTRGRVFNLRGVDRTRHKQIRRASGAQPNVRYTSPRYQTGQQTLSPPIDPPLCSTGLCYPNAILRSRTFNEPVSLGQRNEPLLSCDKYERPKDVTKKNPRFKNECPASEQVA
jgi:hypothetical protein